MITGFDQFYRRPLPGEYEQQSAPNYEMMVEDQSVIESFLSNNIIGTTQIKDASITNAKIKEINAEKINTSTLTAVVDVGIGESGAYVRIDGPNNRIIVNDGQHDRILLGYQENGF